MPNNEEPNDSDNSLLGLSDNKTPSQNSAPNIPSIPVTNPIPGKQENIIIEKPAVPTQTKPQQSSVSQPFEPQIKANTTQQVNIETEKTGDTNNNIPAAPEHKKSKLWLVIILILVIIGLLGGGGYWYYKTQILSGKTVIAKYNKGPSLSTYKKDVGYFEYSNNLSALVYQQNGNILGDFNLAEKNYFLMISPYGGNLISISPYNDFAVIYYADSPKISESDTADVKTFKTSLKDAAGKFYLVNLGTNLFESLGTGLNNFIWTPDNLFFLTNDNSELWTYDFRMANYTGLYDPSIQIFYKVTDLTYPIVDIKAVPDSNALYIISAPANSNTSSLYSFDVASKKFAKVADTNASIIDFSTTGKYYVLSDVTANKMSIYNTTTNVLVTDISESEIMPMRLTWSADDTIFYYFKQGERISDLAIFNTERKRPSDVTNYYDLIKYDIASKGKTVLLNGKDKNIANPSYVSIDTVNSIIYFSTYQTKNIYSFSMK